MNNPIQLHSTTCAICGDGQASVEVYPANFSPQDLNPEIFSARRIPDKIHYRIVRCRTCGLVRSDPVIDPVTLADLYSKSSQNYDREVINLMDSYSRYLHHAVQILPGLAQGRLLEIGCGSGFFLEKALEGDFEHVLGVEPSHSAVEKASPQIKPNIICDMLRPGLLQPEQVDMICMFQVFDHVAAPGEFLNECRQALKSGGGILCLNHDVRAFTNRLMGERSPIIDIEHTYLYDQDTIRRIFSDHGFQVVEVGAATNTLSLRYLLQLFPFPAGLKQSLLALFKGPGIGDLKLNIQLGNLYLVARKS
jgi:SAM-dependent methyltransferase